MKKTICRTEKVTIPTYEIGAYDKNPMFLEKRVYQGSSGRVYPHAVCEKVSDEKTDREYTAVFLENDYILVMILPEIGGRIQRLYDKTTGYDAVYYNEVIKPALVGLVGPWISGGIEFNWPQHHRPSTFDPVDHWVTENDDGSVTVWVGETEKMFHQKTSTAFTVYPDKAFLEIRGQFYNPTDRPQTFLWWANPAVSVNDHTRSIFPPDVTAVMDHGKRDVSTFHFATGTYYKVDYSPGTDISRYKNVPVPTSYMAAHSDFDFVGNYDDAVRAGLLHVADHHISPGKKQWTWGNGDFGRAWDRNLTDENGPYIELMTGVYTDNQPDFTFLKPYEKKSFTQYFMPYRQVGGVKNASKELLMNLECAENAVRVLLYAPVELGNVTLELLKDGAAVCKEELTLHTSDVFEKEIPLTYEDPCSLTLRAVKDEKVLLSYTPLPASEEPVPSPAEALPEPEKVATNEQLFLAATHLEQYRHATRSPGPYYLEGLRRDPTDIRLNNGYGKYLYKKGLFEKALPCFRQAVKSATWKNPNPYDCEPYYYLGLTLKALGQKEEAYDAFYKAAWDGNQQRNAFYQLALLAAEKEAYEQALFFAEQSLQNGLHNLKARLLKTTLLRLTGRTEEAISFAKETRRIDPLDHGSLYELYRLTEEEALLQECRALLRNDAHNYIELALSYRAAGMKAEEAKVLHLAPKDSGPLLLYYLYDCTGNDSELAAAEAADSLYCFPNRLEDIEVLQKAATAGGQYAKYYLGCLYYDRERHADAAVLWEECASRISLPTVYRNLSLYYYNKAGQPDKAGEAMEKAFAMDQTDARIFFELDQFYKITNRPASERLDKMEAHPELLAQRDDLYTEYITLLNMAGRYREAYERTMNHKFHPWEGGEGKIPAQYRSALKKMALACMDEDRKKAVSLLTQALAYPENLGEGKLIGSKDNDLYYLLGTLAENEEEAKEYYTKATMGDGTLGSAMYYNDQPPQMTYYAALAYKKLGEEEKAEQMFRAFLDYGAAHMDDEITIDYFAVSLPDFLIFDADLNKKNQVHCCLMNALGSLGLGQHEEAAGWIEKGLALEQCSQVLLELKEQELDM